MVTRSVFGKLFEDFSLFFLLLTNYLAKGIFGKVICAIRNPLLCPKQADL
jgi:hypothetical protein